VYMEMDLCELAL